MNSKTARTLYLSFQTENRRALIDAMLERVTPFVAVAPPTIWGTNIPSDVETLTELRNRGFQEYSLLWKKLGISLYSESALCKSAIPQHFWSPGPAIQTLGIWEMPFEISVCSAKFFWRLGPTPEHSTGTGPAKAYKGPGLGQGHYRLGWFAAFKGDVGHQHVVHRRYLDYGPWRTHHLDEDVTVVEFHDPDAEEFVALEQAKPGHVRLWNAYSTAHSRLPQDYDYGTFNRKTRTITRSVAPGVVITEPDMSIMAIVRNFNRLDVGRIDHVQYTFLRPADAHQHLHELWLHGHGCTTFIDGREVDLAAHYDPGPPIDHKPEWVKALLAT